MHIHVWLTGGILVASLVAGVPPAQGQLFGKRMFGQTLSRRVGPGNLGSPAGDTAGTLTGAERFVRGNRRAGEFVGINSRAGQDFVGRDPSAEGGRSGNVSTSRGRQRTPGAGRRSGSRLNPRLRPVKPGFMYHPRLDVAFQVDPPPTAWRADQLKSRLEQSLQGFVDQPFEVTVEGRTATLRGVVDSQDSRELAEILATFEPGISQVENQLTVD